MAVLGRVKKETKELSQWKGGVIGAIRQKKKNAENLPH